MKFSLFRFDTNIPCVLLKPVMVFSLNVAAEAVYYNLQPARVFFF